MGYCHTARAEAEDTVTAHFGGGSVEVGLILGEFLVMFGHLLTPFASVVKYEVSGMMSTDCLDISSEYTERTEGYKT